MLIEGFHHITHKKTRPSAEAGFLVGMVLTPKITTPRAVKQTGVETVFRPYYELFSYGTTVENKQEFFVSRNLTFQEVSNFLKQPLGCRHWAKPA